MYECFLYVRRKHAHIRRIRQIVTNVENLVGLLNSTEAESGNVPNLTIGSSQKVARKVDISALRELVSLWMLE